MSDDKIHKYIDLLLDLTKSSTCIRRHTAAIIVDKDDNIVGRGWNGAPDNVVTCASLNSCFREDQPSGLSLDACTAVHAELAAILDALSCHHDIFGGSIYCTDSPCMSCLKSIVHMGLSNIYYMRDYPIVHTISYQHVASSINMSKMDFDKFKSTMCPNEKE